MTLPLYDSRGNRIHLEASIAVGGEGTIHRLSGGGGLLAKIYSSPPDLIGQLKLLELVRIHNPALEQFSAWPQELLFENTQGTKIVGFLMQDFGDSIPLKDLFADSSRIFHFPQLTWTGLIQIAENTARAVNIAHSHNLVIGDLHPRNILVNKSAFPRLIDCDSFQITTPQRVFRSVARLPEYLPPELHGVDVSKLDGTPNHDRFGLAMIIFQCLFVGKNPFSGQFLGQGDLELETAIKQQRYAYGPNARQREMVPPIDALQPEHMTPEIATLFERAFLTIKNRPTAAEWITALTNLKKQLTSCPENRSHSRLASQSACPFCELQQKTGVGLFPNANAEAIVKANSVFAVPPECGQIKTLTFPAVQLPVPPASINKSNAVLPSKAIDFIRFEILCIVICCIAVLVTLFSSRLGFGPTIPAAIVLACAGAALMARSTSPLIELTSKLQLNSHQHESDAHKKETELSNYLQSHTVTFDQLVREGQNASQQIQDELARTIEQTAIRQAKSEAQQRKDWLRSHKIQPLCVRNLTVDQCKQLHAVGLMTAADILPHRLDNAAFLTREQRQLLLTWTDSIRNTFQCPAFQPSLSPGSFRSEFQFYSICTSRVAIVRDRLTKATAIANATSAKIAQSITFIANQRARAIEAKDQVLQLRKLHKAAYDRTVLASVAGIVLMCSPIVPLVQQRSDNESSSTTDLQQTPVAIAENESPSIVDGSATGGTPIQLESASRAVYRSGNVNEAEPETVKVQRISFPLPKPLKRPPLKAAVEPSRSKSESPDIDEPSPRMTSLTPAEPRPLKLKQPKPQPAPATDAHSLFISGVQFFQTQQSVAADSALRSALVAPNCPIETGFLLAINSFRRNEPIEARQQLREALIRANGCTPQQVYFRLSSVQGRDRQWFECTRCELENELRKSFSVERSQRRFSEPRRRASNRGR